MKPAKEIYIKWINDPANESIPLIEIAEKAMKEYALQVAAEQDKITRHAAAEIVLTVGGERNPIKAHRDIMNLQTQIKELKCQKQNIFSTRANFSNTV